MRKSTLKPVVVAAYFADHLTHLNRKEELWINPAVKDYPFVPFVKSIPFEGVGEVKLHSVTSGTVIECHDRAADTGRSYKDDVYATTKIDVSGNGIAYGDTVHVFNYSGKTLGLTIKDNPPGIYLPLVNHDAHPAAKGKLLVVVVNTLNSTRSIKLATGNDNGIAAALEREQRLGHSRGALLYESALRLEEAQPEAAKVRQTIRVISALCIGEEDLRYLPEGELSVASIELSVRLAGEYLSLIKPNHTGSGTTSEELMRLEGFSEYFINDPEISLKPKFTLHFGEAVKLKVTQNSSTPGLYKVVHGKSPDDRTVTLVADLDQIPGLDYLFDTKEEALAGGSKALLRSLELENKKYDTETRKLDHTLTVQEREVEKLNTAMMADMQKLRLQMERDAAAHSLAMKKELDSHALAMEKMQTLLAHEQEKHAHDRNNRHYEHRTLERKEQYAEKQFGRDIITDGLKLALAAGTIVVGTLALAGKFSKKPN